MLFILYIIYRQILSIFYLDLWKTKFSYVMQSLIHQLQNLFKLFSKTLNLPINRIGSTNNCIFVEQVILNIFIIAISRMIIVIMRFTNCYLLLFSIIITLYEMCLHVANHNGNAFYKEQNNFALYIFANDIFVENHYMLREKKMQKTGIYLEVVSLIGGILSAPSKTWVISLFSFSSIDKYSHMTKARFLLDMLNLKFLLRLKENILFSSF